eukprot:Hpha_TRINITY_DN18835_c0_g1::TRINITY_DN18835_c0_g1_i1::g.26351::m.26351
MDRFRRTVALLAPANPFFDTVSRSKGDNVWTGVEPVVSDHTSAKELKAVVTRMTSRTQDGGRGWAEKRLMSRSLTRAVFETIERLREKGRPVGNRTYNTAFAVFARCAVPHVSRVLYSDMTKHNVTPDLQTFNTWLSAEASRSREEATVQRVLDEMKRVGIEPDGETRDNLIRFWSHRGEKAKVEKLVADQRAFGTVTHQTYYAMMAGARTLDECGPVVTQMLSEGYPLDRICFTHLLATCSREGNPKGGEQVFVSMRRIGVRPDSSSYAQLMVAYDRADDMAGLSAVYRRMVNDGVAASASVYAALLEACTKRTSRVNDNYQQIGRQAFRQAVSEGCALRGRFLHTHVMKLYAAGGDADKARQLLQTMKSESRSTEGPVQAAHDEAVDRARPAPAPMAPPARRERREKVE